MGRFSYARIVDFFIAPLETCQFWFYTPGPLQNLHAYPWRAGIGKPQNVGLILAAPGRKQNRIGTASTAVRNLSCIPV